MMSVLCLYNHPTVRVNDGNGRWDICTRKYASTENAHHARDKIITAYCRIIFSTRSRTCSVIYVVALNDKQTNCVLIFLFNY